MPRSFVKGTQIRDKSIRDVDLADDAVVTRTIKDKNVTKAKLADDVCERLLTSSSPIARTKLTTDLLANTDFTLPGGLDYIDSTIFLTRLKVWRNGQLLHNGISSIDPDADFYIGSDTTKIKFTCDIRRNEKITVEII